MSDGKTRLEQAIKELEEVQKKYNVGITYHAEQKDGGLFVKMVVMDLEEKKSKK